MYVGRMVEGGDSETVTQQPAHPYTRLLIDSAPDPGRLLTDGIGYWTGDPDSSTTFPQQQAVDYVHVTTGGSGKTGQLTSLASKCVDVACANSANGILRLVRDGDPHQASPHPRRDGASDCGVDNAGRPQSADEPRRTDLPVPLPHP
jgi:hypothetical protein